MDCNTDLASEMKRRQYVGQQGIADMLGVSVRTVQRIRADDATFPAPIKPGVQHLRWRIADVLAWDDARQKGKVARLLAKAAASPDDVPVEEIPATIDKLSQRLLASPGAQRLSKVVGALAQPVTADQLSALDVADASELLDRLDTLAAALRDLDAVAAGAVANWLFPALRELWAGAGEGYLPTDDATARHLAIAAIADLARAWGALPLNESGR